jgi:lipopolysaccharide export LptBFGC system permease protein LptF
VLAGILITFGRMGAQSEVTAMRAGGVPLWRIASPVVAMAAVLAAGAAYINLELAPAANTAYRGILRGAVTDNPAAAIIPGELCRNFPGVVIRASTREAGTLGDLWVWQVAEDGQLTQSLHARSAVTLLVPGEDGGPDRLRISARDVRVEQRRPGDNARLQTSTYASMERAELDFPLRRTAGSGQRKLRWLTTAELIEAMDKGWQLPATATAEQLDASRLQARRQLNAHLGGALGIFSLAVLAVPLSLRVGRRETFVNAAVALGVAEDRVDAVRTWRAVVARAVAVARGATGAPPGPVHLNIPTREPTVPVAADGRVTAPLFTTPLAGRDGSAPWLGVAGAPTAVDPATVERLATRIDGVRRGLILVGAPVGGFPVSADAVDALAAVTGWPVVAEVLAPERDRVHAAHLRAVGEAQTSEELAATVADVHGATVARWRSLLESSLADGVVRTDLDPEALAMLIVAVPLGLAAVLPGATGPTVLVDAGANLDTTPQQ